MIHATPTLLLSYSGTDGKVKEEVKSSGKLVGQNGDSSVGGGEEERHLKKEIEEEEEEEVKTKKKKKKRKKETDSEVCCENTKPFTN